MSASYKYMGAKELSELIKKDSQGPKDYAVVDVRDHDFIGGNIVGCVRSPSMNFEKNVDKLVTELKDAPKVIFHCYLSQQRGPKCARIFAETRDNRLEPGQKSTQEVFVLRGGFSDFQQVYHDDSALVERWKADLWETWN